MTKPVLMYMLEELIDSEIEDIYLIVGEGEEEDGDEEAEEEEDGDGE